MVNLFGAIAAAALEAAEQITRSIAHSRNESPRLNLLPNFKSVFDMVNLFGAIAAAALEAAEQITRSIAHSRNESPRLKFLHDFKSVFNVINLFGMFAAQIDFHNVKAASAIAKSFVLQENACRLDDFFLLAEGNSLARQAVKNVRTRLDFHEDKHVIPLRDYVNLR